MREKDEKDKEIWERLGETYEITEEPTVATKVKIKDKEGRLTQSWKDAVEKIRKDRLKLIRATEEAMKKEWKSWLDWEAVKIMSLDFFVMFE